MAKFTQSRGCSPSYEMREQRRIANRKAMIEEGEFYTNEFTKLQALGHNHNYSSQQAVILTRMEYNTRGRHHRSCRGYYHETTPTQCQRGRLVYIGAYKSLQQSLQNALSVGACCDILERELLGFCNVRSIFESICSTKPKLFRAVLTYVGNVKGQESDLYQELNEAWMNSVLVD